MSRANDEDGAFFYFFFFFPVRVRVRVRVPFLPFSFLFLSFLCKWRELDIEIVGVCR